MLNLLVPLALLSASTSAPLETVSQEPSAEDIEAIAEEAFVYGFPLVVGYGVMYEYAIDKEAQQYKAPFNRIYNTARVYSPADTAVQTPNSDTPYSFAWVDLRAEPVVFQVPKVEEGRYFSVQLVDLYTFNYGYVGSRVTGNRAGTYMIVGPGWDGEAPDGIDGVFRCETHFTFVVFRTQLFGPGDLDAVKRVQAGYAVETLSAFQGTPPPPAAPVVDWPRFDPDRAQVDPFTYLAFLMQFCPPTAASEGERDLRARFARIGIAPGRPFALDRLDDDRKAAFVAGVKRGFAKVRQRIGEIGRSANGWRLGAAAGDRAFYDGDWALRAAGAMAGIYGNSQAEAFYPFLATDSEGNAPDGSSTRYTMTFSDGGLPPVNAFWSITIYDGKTQFLVDNPIDRYLINSPMLGDMKRGDDGSLTIYIQKDSPGRDRESNWLPAPDGPIFLVMRLYWPDEQAIDGTWTPPPVVPTPSGPSLNPSGAPVVQRRLGDKSVETIVRTDERYGSDPLFQGPRGWTYWNGLSDPRPIQNPNLWPDKQSTYFISRFELPAGSELAWSFEFPHARYFQFALYKHENDTFVSTGEYLSGAQMEPDPGSTNPFRVGADRRSGARDCTLRVVAADAPADGRDPNTLYAGEAGGLLQAVVRIYLSDAGWDGAGWRPATAPGGGLGFRYEGRLADGTQLSAQDVARRFAQPFEGATAQPLDADRWVALVNAEGNDPSLEPATSPARPGGAWEKYWNLRYSILGSFKAPEERARIPFAGPMDGGGDPTTQYFLAHISRRFGPVYVLRGRMPTFPDTHGEDRAVQPDAQVQYWSIVSCEAVPSGHIVDGLCDMQVPLDADRNYTIVVSREVDRPANATLENGVAWLEWSARGEGLDDQRNREDFGMLMIRIMATNPTWAERPENVTRPGTEEDVLGPYLPRGEYTDRNGFEALGNAVSAQ